jgi:hypothetical protein
VKRFLIFAAVAMLAAVAVAGCQSNTGTNTGTDNQNSNKNVDITALIQAWAESTHSVPVSSQATRVPCAGCHDGQAFSRGVDDPAQLADRAPFGPYVVATDCRACHIGQGADIMKAGEATIPSQTDPIKGGKGAVCMACHNQEIKPDITAAEHPYPHYGPQAEVLKGIGGILDGLTVGTTAKHADIKDSCVACHIGTDIAKGHTFAPTTDQCKKCHKGFTDPESVDAKADYDGDGQTEKFVDEVDGLMVAVAEATNQKAGSDKFTTSRGDIFFVSADTTMTSGIPQEAYQGAFNWVLIDHDKSRGIHNPYFTVTLLQETYRAVSGAALPNAEAPKPESN